MKDITTSVKFQFSPEKGFIKLEGDALLDLGIEAGDGIDKVEEKQPDLVKAISHFIQKKSIKQGHYLMWFRSCKGVKHGLVTMENEGKDIVGEVVLLDEKLLSMGWSEELKRCKNENQRMKILISDMIDSLLYEIRNSASHILLVINFMEISKEGIGEELRRKLEEIKEEIEYILRHMEDLHKRIKSFTRDINLDLNLVNIRELISESIHDLNPVIKMKKIVIYQNLDVSNVIIADKDLLKSAFEALLELTTMKANVNSEISITGRKLENSILQISVSYVGKAIEENEKYFLGGDVKQMDKNTNKIFSGYKYYFAKVFIEMHGGSFTVESMEGVGSTIFIELPVIKGESV